MKKGARIFDIPKYFTPQDFKKMGVYFLIKNGKIVYIGQTVNVLGRLASHELRHSYDRIRLIQCSLEMLDFYEKRWIIKFRPKYNRQHLFKKIGGWRIGYRFKKINIKTVKRSNKNSRSVNGEIVNTIRESFDERH